MFIGGARGGGILWKRNHIELINSQVISLTTCSEFNYGKDSEVDTKYMKYPWENQVALPLEAFYFLHFLEKSKITKNTIGRAPHI